MKLVNISKRKGDTDSPFISPCSSNLTSKRRWGEASCYSFLVFTFLFQCRRLAPLIFIKNNIISLSPHISCFTHHSWLTATEVN
jgi:hypothetical protein